MTDVLIPYSFVPGTKAMASEVNANFIALAQGVEDCKTFTNQSMEDFDEQVSKRLDEAIGDKLNLNFSNSVNITNSVIEVPQRIKYTIEDGTLTIKAGSVVIVPYGVEDLSAAYPAGATFINNNFKVYDTQYADGKFFVWAELVNDIVTNTSVVAGDVATRLTEIDLTRSCANAVINTISSATQYSGTSNCINYRTDLNLVQWTTSGTFTNNVVSLPFLKVTADGANIYGSVSQVFNGFGYIGSTIWADKGIKGLKTNGRNADGSLRNEEFVLDSVKTNNTFNLNSTYYAIISDSSNSISRATKSITSYDEENNYIYRDDGLYKVGCIVAEVVATTEGITSFTPKLPFQAVDYCDFRNEINTLSKAYITQTYKSGSSWYRIWSDGWKEQGGVSTENSTSSTTFLKAFSNANYTIAMLPLNSNANAVSLTSKTATMFAWKAGSNYNSDTASWYACGY